MEQVEKVQKINKLAGILSIIGAAVFPLSFWFVVFSVMGEVSGANFDDMMAGNLDVSTPISLWIFRIFALISLGVFIYGLVLSKKENVKITGHVLGIIGTSFFIISPIFPGLVAMTLLIIAAVSTLKVSKELAISDE